MLRQLRGANVLAMGLDLVGAVVLALYALIVGPLGVLRGPIAFERTVWYLWVLWPQGLLARSIRAAIDWRLGNFDSAIAQLEGLVGANEEYYKDRPASRSRRRVLEDLYTVLARAYLHAGHIDDAMLVVIRAKKSMQIDRLAGLAELDAKTAHLVRAGLAAGRLLDGGGLATMFVKSNQQEPRPTGRQGATRGDGGGVGREVPLGAGARRPRDGAAKGRTGAPETPGGARPRGAEGATEGGGGPSDDDHELPLPEGDAEPTAKIIPFPSGDQHAP